MLKQNESMKELQDSMGRALSFIPLAPDHWTYLSIIIAIAGGITIAFYNDLVTGLVFFALAALFDVIDGAVARARKQTSDWGGFIDGIADRFVEAIFLFSFMFYALPEILIDARIWLASVIFLGTCMPSFIRAYSDHKGILEREKALALSGICERSERLLIIIIGLALGMVLSMDFFVYALVLASILSIVTIVQRLTQIRSNI